MHLERSIHEFTFPSIEGGVIDFTTYKGKKILVVNTASDCMYTGQYVQLQELFELHGDKLTVIGFPSNDFGDQEPGTNREIKTFCSYNYGVTFPLASKSNVTGKEANPVFKWLTEQDFKNSLNKEITWNFQKFLLDENGQLIEVFTPATDPINDVLVELISIEGPADK